MLVKVKFILCGIQFYRFQQILRILYFYNDHDTEQFYQPLKFLLAAPLNQHFSSPQPQTITDIFHPDYSFSECHINGIAHYVFWLGFSSVNKLQ